jgi:membrane-bound metal-dependent hydrolase YbcI (DUF457 family)
MLGKTHLVTGAVSASWAAVPMAALGVPPTLVLLSIPVGAYAALLPDIDHHSSMITWSCPPISNAISWLVRGCPYDLAIIPAFRLPIVGWGWDGWGRSGWLLPAEFTVSTGHRQETHTEEFALIAGVVIGMALLPFTWWSWVFGVQTTIGCLTHDWGDLRTTGGLRHRSGTGRRTIGWTFDVNSPHEHWLRMTVYRPLAVLSVVCSVLIIAYISGGAL